MTPRWWLLWSLTGILLAYGFLKSQAWTVNRISPGQPGLSKRLVVGGAVLRWLIMASVLTFALAQSLGAALTVFVTYMVTRLFILFLGQKSLFSPSNRANSFKD